MATEIAPRIALDPEIRHGKPVIAGTRVPVEVIVGHLAAGMPVADVAEEFGIEHEDVYAALRYAAMIVASEEVHISR